MTFRNLCKAMKVVSVIKKPDLDLAWPDLAWPDLDRGDGLYDHPNTESFDKKTECIQ